MNPLILSNERLDECAEKISESISEAVRRAGASGAILGVSGGVDSALVAALAKRSAIDLHCMVMPEEGVSCKEDIEDAVGLIEGLGLPYSIVAINKQVAAFEESFPWQAFPCRDRRLAMGNVKARTRMIIDYMAANACGRIVLGTGNRTEILLGYFTKYGDAGVDVLPIGDLYKTQVRQLAARLKVPDRIIAKKPTAGLWPNQTDEGEIGASYEEMDRVLYSLTDEGLSINETAKRTGIKSELVEKLAERMEKAAHKREMPKITGLFR